MGLNHRLTGAEVAGLVPSGTFAPMVAPTVVYLGDSISALNYATDSSVTRYSTRGYLTWANALLSGRLRLLNPAGGGVGGNTTAQMLARITTDVLAYAPGWCLVEGGSNDISTGVAVATIEANLQAIYEALRAVGIRVVATTIIPRAASDESATMLANRLIINQWIKDYVRTNKQMVLVDWHPALTDPSTGKADTTGRWFVSDAIHPAGEGAARMGTLLYRALDPIIPAADLLTDSNVDPANLLTNGMFTSPAGYLNLPGTSGNYASAPDSAPLSGTGDIDLRAYFVADDWTSTTQFLVAKWVSSGNQRSYALRVSATGFLEAQISTTGANSGTPASTVAIPFADSSGGWLRATYASATGTTTFYTSTDPAATAPGSVAWTQLGSTVAAGLTGSAFDSTSVLEIGSREVGTTNLAKGKLYRAQVLIATVLQFDASFTSLVGGTTSIVESSSNAATVTINGSTSIGNLATGWALSHDAGNAATPTKVNIADGLSGQWQQVQVTANTTAGNTTYLYYENANVGVDWSVGDTIIGEVEVETDNDWAQGSGGASRMAPNLVVTFVGGTGTAQAMHHASADPAVRVRLAPTGATGAVRCVLRTPAVIIPSGTTKLQFQCNAGLGATGTTRWRRARLRKVTAGTLT